jgi:hypothetical protein
MKKSPISFESIPRGAISTTTLNICLRCAFDFFKKQLKLSPRTAYSELKKHVPEAADFSGAATSRPHFFETEAISRCPYCNGSNRWFARFKATRIDEYPGFEKQRKQLWRMLKQQQEQFVLWNPERTQMQIFSEWLDRLNRRLSFDDDGWLMELALETVKRSDPAFKLDEADDQHVRRVQVSRDVEGPWKYDRGFLFVSELLYAEILLIQHLVSRSHLHGGRTFEGHLTLAELMGRIRRLRYFERKGIDAPDPQQAFERAVLALVASGPAAVYYAVDRSEYLVHLKSVYEKKRDK